jgi:prepilin peptidase CpaA
MLSLLLALVFPALMAYAAFSDLFTMRITNWLVIAVGAAYFALALIVQLDWAAVGWASVTAAAALAVAFAFFAFGWIGGGDAKLIAATVLWTGLGLLLQYLIYAALLGGALTLIILALRRYPLPPRLASLSWLDRLHDPKTGVPYGIALAIAAILVYPQTAIFVRLMSL